MGNILGPGQKDLDKWRQQAHKAAATLKGMKITQEVFKTGFVFDDAVIKVPISRVVIETLTEKELMEHIYQKVLDAAETKRS